MNDIKYDEPGCEQHSNKYIKQLAFWTLAWVASTAFLRFGAEYIWDFDAAFSIAALITHLAFGFAMIKVNVKHLTNLDELQRKITMDAMGITLGVGLIAGIAYEQLEDIKLITFEPEINHLIMLMAITYIVSMFFGNRNYQ
jgi:hypothetical protein